MFGPHMGQWAHMGQGPWAHWPGPILKIFDFLDFFDLSEEYVFFDFLGSLMAPSEFFFVTKMLAIGLSNLHNFIEMCQNY